MRRTNRVLLCCILAGCSQADPPPPTTSSAPAAAPVAVPVDETTEAVRFLQGFRIARDAADGLCHEARRCTIFQSSEEERHPRDAEACLVERLPACVVASDLADAELARAPETIRDLLARAVWYGNTRAHAEAALAILRDQAPRVPPDVSSPDVFSWRIDDLSPPVRAQVDAAFELPLPTPFALNDWFTQHNACLPHRRFCTVQNVETGQRGYVRPEHELPAAGAP
jgi:hypothetical protein